MSSQDFVTRTEHNQLRSQVQNLIPALGGQTERINIQETNVNDLRDTRGNLTESLDGNRLNITNV